MKNKFLGLLILGIIAFLLQISFKGEADKVFHSESEITFYKNHFRTPLDSGEYFSLPENCKGCHGYDSLALANVDASGNDVNLFDDWETSMMGLSGVDPLWKAKVSHEALTNPSHSNELQTLCTSCHAPQGHYSAKFKGQAHYLLSDLANDSLGKAGVACHSCHAIKDSIILGTQFTGIIPYDTNRNVYGPFPNPFVGPMQLYEGLLAKYSPHVSEGRFCSSCHTLISNTVDINGNATGGTFVEQATFHEWKNSAYPDQDVSCQSCHMTELEDPIKIANGYLALQARSPFNLHQFQGANSFMVKLIKDNKIALGVNADDANFDSTLSAINTMLTTQTLNVSTTLKTIQNDSVDIDVELENKAGHKFPSGYPARRAVLQFVVTKSNGDTLFASGIFDSNYEVQNITAPFEPHHQNINNQNQSQIYEMIMGDVNGDRTTVLERSAIMLKDNRLPPLGFSTLHQAYDTCKIVGDALTDLDFNFVGALEGSGKDIVHYKVGLKGYIGTIKVHAKVYYQSVPPFWLSEMSTFSSNEIDSFLLIFNAADKSPVLIAQDSITSIAITSLTTQNNQSKVTVSPNPSYDGIFSLNGLDTRSIQLQVYDANGKSVNYTTIFRNQGTLRIQINGEQGLYYIVVNSPSKPKQILKVIKLN